MKLGGLEVHLITDGCFYLDGGAMYGVIPKPLWEKVTPPDPRNRIRLSMNCLLVRTAGQTVLIEAGAGDKLDAKRNDIFGLGGPPRLLDQLAALSVKPEDVSLVLNTHLHFDHCGWNTRILNGRAVPTFPNARYAVQRGELEWAGHPSERDRGSYMAENLTPITEAGKWWLLEGDGEVAPGIRVMRVPGHNRDMQCVRLDGGGHTLFLPVDLCPTRHHVATHWVMSYDLYPMQTMENKKKWLAEAARNKWHLLFCHEPDTPSGFLQEQEGKLVFQAVPFS